MPEICKCTLDVVYVARALDKAKERLRRVEKARALLQTEFVREQLPKIEKCFGLDMSEVDRSLAKVREHIDELDEARRWLDKAYGRFYRTLRECKK